MNHKQKLGYMALGAGVLALGIIIGQWATPDIEAQGLNEIVCHKLLVVDENGKPAILLSNDEDSNWITVYDKRGNQAVSLGSEPEGNTVTVYNKQREQGNQAVILASLWSANGVTVYDKQGDHAVGLTSDPAVGNVVVVKNYITGERTTLD